MHSPASSLIVLASLLSTCLGALYESFDDLPTTEYDYIVVGVRRLWCLFRILLTKNVRVGRHCWQCNCQSVERVGQYYRSSP